MLNNQKDNTAQIALEGPLKYLGLRRGIALFITTLHRYMLGNQAPCRGLGILACSLSFPIISPKNDTFAELLMIPKQNLK